MDLQNKTIVIIYMLYFGDMVSISPFLEVLRRNAKGSRIVLVTDLRFVDAVRYNPNVDTIIPVDRKNMGLFGTWQVGRKIGAMHPDLLLVLHGTTRTSLMAFAMHAGQWMGEAGTRVDSLFMNQEILVERRDCHASDKYVKVLEALGVSDISYEGMKIFTCPSWEKGAASFFASAGIDKTEKLAGFSVGSSTAGKNWPAEKYGEVADALAERGYRPVFFGVSGEMPLIEKAMFHMKHKEEAVVAAGHLSMGEFMAAASRCAVAFTNDSGPMYVFDSRGVPTIALFGPSNVKLHHPLGKRSCGLASTDMPMTQDYVNHTIRDKAYVPIEKIPVAEVIRSGEWALGLFESSLYEKHYIIVEG